MNKLSIITAIVQAISGLILAGLAIYYATAEDMIKFWVFLLVGIIFIVLPIRAFFRNKKERDTRREIEKKDDNNKGSFI